MKLTKAHKKYLLMGLVGLGTFFLFTKKASASTKLFRGGTLVPFLGATPPAVTFGPSKSGEYYYADKVGNTWHFYKTGPGQENAEEIGGGEEISRGIYNTAYALYEAGKL